MKVIVILCLGLSATCALADSDGQYVPDDSGKYIPGDEGHYVHDSSGDYNHDGTGNYRGDSAGRYSGDRNGARFGGSNRNFIGQSDNQFRRSGSPSGFRANVAASSSSSTNSLIGANSFVNEQTVSRNQYKFNNNNNAYNSNNNNNDDGTFGNFGNSPAAANPIPVKASRNSFGNGNRYSSGLNTKDGRWKILKQNGDVDSDGYHWDFESENGIVAEESGKVANKGTDKEGMKAQGFYKYTGPDNVQYTVQYTADENGFNAQGPHLPTPPPTPDAILKSLEFLRQQGKL